MSTPTTTFTWTIQDLARTLSDGIVFAVHFAVSADDGTYASSGYDVISLEPPAEGDSVIPFADLTSEICCGWVKDKIGADKVATVEADLQAKIDEQRTPTKGTGTPW